MGKRKIKLKMVLAVFLAIIMVISVANSDMLYATGIIFAETVDGTDTKSLPIENNALAEGIQQDEGASEETNQKEDQQRQKQPEEKQLEEKQREEELSEEKRKEELPEEKRKEELPEEKRKEELPEEKQKEEAPAYVPVGTPSDAVHAGYENKDITVATKSEAEVRNKNYDLERIIKTAALLHEEDYSDVTEDNPLTHGERAVFRFEYKLKSSMRKALDSGNDIILEYQLPEEILGLTSSYQEMVGTTFADGPMSSALGYMGEFNEDGNITICIQSIEEGDIDNFDQIIDIPVLIDCEITDIPEKLTISAAHSKKLTIYTYVGSGKFEYEETIGDITIYLWAEEGVLPDDAKVRISEVAYDDENALGGMEQITGDAGANQIIAFDISIWVDHQEIEIEDGTVKVSFRGSRILDYSGKKAEVFHIDEQNGVEIINSKQLGDEIQFEAKHFSVYGIHLTAVNYPSVDYSEEIKPYRVTYPESSGCAIASIATVEKYNRQASDADNMYYRVKSWNDNAISIKDWSGMGYGEIKDNPTLETLYTACKENGPCIIHRNTTVEHFSVLVGYTGNTSVLEEKGFKVLEVSDTITNYLMNLHDWRRYTYVNGSVQYDDNAVVDRLLIRTGVDVSFFNVNASDLQDTSGRLSSDIQTTTGSRIQSVGVYLGKSENQMQKISEPAEGTVKKIFYEVGTGKWCGPLSAGTKYFYQFYVQINDLEFKSDVFSFNTAGISDTEKPVIKNVRVAEVTTDGFTVYCTVADDRMVSKLTFAVWNEKEGKEKLVSGGPTNHNGYAKEKEYQHRVNVIDHDFTYDAAYYMMITAEDEAGNTADYSLRMYMPRPFESTEDGWPIANSRRCFGYSDDYHIPKSVMEDVYGWNISSILPWSAGPVWHGSCFGLSVLASRYYTNQGSPLTHILPKRGNNHLYQRGYYNLDYSQGIYTIAKNYNAIRMIERVQVSQDTQELADIEVYKNDNNLKQFKAYMCTGPEGFEPKFKAFVITLSYKTGAHAVVVETDRVPWTAGDGWTGIYVYDSNAPANNGDMGLNSFYHKGRSYIRINDSNGDWEYYYNGELKGKSGRGDMKIYDPSKLGSSFFTDKLHKKKSSGWAWTADIDAENMTIKDSSDGILLEIKDGELIQNSEDTDFSIMCTDLDEQDGRLKGYFYCSEDEFNYNAHNADIMIASNELYISASHQTEIKADVDLQNGSLSLENVQDGEVSIGLQTNENKYKAVAYENNNQSGDYVTLSLEKSGRYNIESSQATADNFSVDSNGTTVRLEDQRITELEGKTVGEIVSEHSSNDVKPAGVTNVSSDSDERDIGIAVVTDTYPGAHWNAYEDGRWKLVKADGNEVKGWAMVQDKWYYLNPEDGFMMTGWLRNQDGRWYYLRTVHDGYYGAIVTGWNIIDGKRYYFNENHDGYYGALMIEE